MTQTQLSVIRCRGYLTVFLSLSLTIILSLVLTLIEGARIYAIRMQTECIVRTALDSCLAEYSRELENRYGLFYVDASYGGSPEEENVTSHVKDYLSRNMEVSTISSLLGARNLTSLSVSSCEITDTRYACDSNGKSVREQIEAYMTAGPEAALASNFLEMFGSYESLDENSWQEAFNESSSEFEEAARAAREEAERIEEEEGERDYGGDEDLRLVEEFLANIREYLGRAFLTQVLGGDGTVSGSSVNGSDLLEDRSLHYGTSYDAENSHDYSEVGSIRMGQYILEHCGNYRETIDGCALQYEAEYILFGMRDDRENLEQMTERLVLLRAAADLAAIHGVESCTRMADLIAEVLDFFLGIPMTVTRELILVIWSYAEAIQDVKTLYKGGKVPILKSASNWQTSFSILGNIGGSGGSSGGSGIDYAMYLRFFLLAADRSDPDTVTERLMNIMELDVTKAQGGTPLYMDWCLDAMKVDVTVASGYGYSTRVMQEITYN